MNWWKRWRAGMAFKAGIISHNEYVRRLGEEPIEFHELEVKHIEHQPPMVLESTSDGTWWWGPSRDEVSGSEGDRFVEMRPGCTHPAVWRWSETDNDWASMKAAVHHSSVKPWGGEQGDLWINNLTGETRVHDGTDFQPRSATADPDGASAHGVPEGQWRADWDHQSADGSTGLANLLWGSDCTRVRSARTHAQRIIDAGWRPGHDYEDPQHVLTTLLRGHDCRNGEEARRVADLIELLGWKREKRVPDVMLWEGGRENARAIIEWMDAPMPDEHHLTTVEVFGIGAEKSVTGRFTAVFKGHAIRRVEGPDGKPRYEVLSPEHPASAIIEADWFDEPVPYVPTEPTEAKMEALADFVRGGALRAPDGTVLIEPEPEGDPDVALAEALAVLHDKIADLILTPENHCQHEYNGGVKNALDLVGHAVRAYGGEVGDVPLPPDPGKGKDDRPSPWLGLADQIGVTRVDTSTPEGKALVASLAEFLPGLAEFLTRKPPSAD